jgi:hypothetical protein
MAQAMRKPTGQSGRIDRLKVATPRQQPDPPRDEHGAWERQVKALALASGVDGRELVKEWAMRSDCRVYCGRERHDANAAAFEDVAARLLRDGGDQAVE